jgi:hypothetical protein
MRSRHESVIAGGGADGSLDEEDDDDGVADDDDPESPENQLARRVQELVLDDMWKLARSHSVTRISCVDHNMSDRVGTVQVPPGDNAFLTACL